MLNLNIFKSFEEKFKEYKKTDQYKNRDRANDVYVKIGYMWYAVDKKWLEKVRKEPYFIDIIYKGMFYTLCILFSALILKYLYYLMI